MSNVSDSATASAMDRATEQARLALAAYDAGGPYPCAPGIAAKDSEQARLWRAVLEANRAMQEASQNHFVIQTFRKA